MLSGVLGLLARMWDPQTLPIYERPPSFPTRRFPSTLDGYRPRLYATPPIEISADGSLSKFFACVLLPLMMNDADLITDD